MPMPVAEHINDRAAAATVAPLLDHFATQHEHLPTATPRTVAGWRIAPVTGGTNNRVLRATNTDYDLALKWTRMDARDRAGREYAALLALAETGLDIAPRAVLLQRETPRSPQPLVVQTWLSGDAAPTPPTNAAEREALLTHLLTIHSVRPAHVSAPLRRAVSTATSADEALALVTSNLALLPPEEQTPALIDLLHRLEHHSAARAGWERPALCLCQCDPNLRNIVRRPPPARWAAVDWEYSGWGDPAYDVADLLTHPSLSDVPQEQRDALLHAYVTATQSSDAQIEQRLRTYIPYLLVWWVIRFTRYLHEIPRGRDRRLTPLPDNWAATMHAQRANYLQRATTALASGA